MKSNSAATKKAATTRRASGASGSVKSTSKAATAPQEDTACQIDIPRDKFRELKATAIQQGFESISAMILHCVTAYAWTSDRITVMGTPKEFKYWNQSARGRGETIDEWVMRSLNEAAELDLFRKPAPPNPNGSTVSGSAWEGGCM